MADNSVGVRSVFYFDALDIAEIGREHLNV
jgi:hypothetical protein